MTKLNNQQKRDFAQSLYLNEKGITQKEIAQRVDVTEATICTWAKRFGWETMRTSLLMTRDEQLSLMYGQLASANTAISQKEIGHQFPTSKEADAILKMATAISRLESEANIGDKMSVGREYLAFVRRTADFELSKMIAKTFDTYIKSCIK